MPTRNQRQILIGVHTTGAASALAPTLNSVFENTPFPFRVCLMLDRVNAAQTAVLQDVYPGITQLACPQQAGAAACFNQLVSEPADVYVFLECGVRVCPSWLDLLLAALDRDISHGLAGPSTNRGWNLQAQAPHCDTTQKALWEQADALLARFGDACQSLAPEHSLGDFCYVVKREVVAAVGLADTAYAQGPCWEMDYNIRAARAGFKGVWVPGAFVYRAVQSVIQMQDQLLLETNKRLYQDRFCAQRSAVEHAASKYHRHCAGDLCHHFARPERTRIFIAPSHTPPTPALSTASTRIKVWPLISCIMPTRGRPTFVAQSIRYFQRQDYPHLELIIVYEDDADLPAAHDMKDQRIRCERVLPGASIGAKRNRAVGLATGELIAQWDDDDWYAPQRLRLQAEPILHQLADVTGLNDMLFMVREMGEFWACSRALFRQMFTENVTGGTLVYRRSLWERHGPYPATSMREDAVFLQNTMRGGARLSRICGRALSIYVRHPGNTWKFKEGVYLSPSAWKLVPAPACIAQDRDFYFPSIPVSNTGPATPLVSCIMPTADRREFVPQAIQNFLAQDYPARELIVLDDGRDSVADLIPQADNIRYLRMEHKSSIGAKRNIACEMARGELIAHWDDDDWMAPAWLSSQVRVMQEEQADLCGLVKVFFFSPETRRAWQYEYDGVTPWVCGGTLCYRKEFWRSLPFKDVHVGEDNAFVWSHRSKRVAVNPALHLYAARVHAGNTSPKDTLNRRWHSHPFEHIEQMIQSHSNVTREISAH